MPVLTPYRADLAQLAAQDRLRTLVPRRGIDVASNDYLALAAAPRLAAAVTTVGRG